MHQQISGHEQLSRKLHLLHTSQAVTLVGSFELNLTTREFLWTDAMFMLLQLPVTPDNKISFSSFISLVRPDQKALVETQLLQIDHSIYPEFDFEIVTNDGNRKTLRAWSVDLADEDGNPVKRGSLQDFTRQKQLDLQLQATNEELTIKAEIAEHAEAISNTGSFEWNLSTGKMKYSDNLYRLFGFSPGEVIPSLELFTSLIHPDDREIIIQQTNDIKAQSEISTSNYRILRNGEVRLLSTRNRKLTNNKSEEILLGSVRDVTEEQETLQKLEQRTLLAESISENNIDMIAAYDNELKLIWWNKQCEKYYGIQRKDVLGKHPLEIFGDNEGREVLKPLQKALQGQQVHIAEKKSLENDTYYEWYYNPIMQNGKAYGVVVITHNLTDLKKANQRLEQLNRRLQERSTFAETLTETSVDAIASYDRELRIIAWNRACEERYKKPKNEVLGKQVLEVFPALAKDERYQDMLQALKGKSFSYPEQYSTTTKSYYQSYLVPLRNEDQEIFAILSITHDITELKKAADKFKRLNRSLEQKNKELEKSNNELVSFSYVASHDLQEPLRKIRTFSERLLEKEWNNLSDTGKDYLKRMDAASLRMQKLIEDLLALSRTSTIPKNFELIDLDLLLKDVKLNLKESIEELNAEIISDNLPHAHVIPIQFQQLLENLLLNSLKYRRPEEVPRIHITCQRVDADSLPVVPEERFSKFFHLTVKDNGIGFEQQYAEKIFEIFQRLHGKQEYSGTGIGLAICRKTMQNHNGFIHAEGTPGEGATFHVYLPVRE